MQGIGTRCARSQLRSLSLERRLHAPLVCDRYARRGLAVPFLRYVVFVGGTLLAMLFLADWVWPSAVPVPAATPAKQVAAESPFEQTIRINSARRWPDKIEFDTTIPTIVPSPPPPIVAE